MSKLDLCSIERQFKTSNATYITSYNPTPYYTYKVYDFMGYIFICDEYGSWPMYKNGHAW
jgi:hypothetical protein